MENSYYNPAIRAKDRTTDKWTSWISGNGGLYLGADIDSSNSGIPPTGDIKVAISGIDGSATFAGSGTFGTGGAESIICKNNNATLNNNATIYAANEGGGTVFLSGPDLSPVNRTIAMFADGSIEAADNKAGFTADGELYFTSRGTRYKLEVAGGLCNAIPYTREMELRERAEALKERIEDKQEPRSTDSVPED